MGKVYTALGLNHGRGLPRASPTAKSARPTPPTSPMATNNELGFDYLRDNMRASLQEMAQARPQLRDRGRGRLDPDPTRRGRPLIISGPSQDRSDLYVSIDKIIPEVQDEHFTLDEKNSAARVSRTRAMISSKTACTSWASCPRGKAFMTPSPTPPSVHHVTNALARAQAVPEGSAVYRPRMARWCLVDEFTGRMMPGRRLSDGLHQAIEAKEGCQIQPPRT